MSELKYWIGFNCVRRMGAMRFRKLERYFTSMEEAWRGPARQLKEAGLDERTIGAVEQARRSVDLEAEMEKLERADVTAFHWKHPAYPPLLKEIHDPPPVLYVRGAIDAVDQRSIAVVGTRRATGYGREAVQALAGDLARRGITIVSGLARGIDTLAHRAALKAGGRTLAVMATGVDIIYPRENAALAQEIIENGALVSEHPLGVRPISQQFPRRNRLMSGMTLGTLLVEGDHGSGALWTVRHALEQNREVFCVPGSIFSRMSRGPNELIRDGAKPVLDYQDILEEINLSALAAPSSARRPAPPPVVAPASRDQRDQRDQIELPLPAPAAVGDEALLLQHVGHEPAHIDQICRGSRLPMNVVNSTLTILEIKGLVQQTPGMNYILTREAAAAYGR